MNAKEVIDAILQREGIDPAQLAKDIGLSRPQAIYDILKGKTKNITDSMAAKIRAAKPAYNKDWLQTGNGDMLNTEYTEVKPLDATININALIHRIDKLIEVHEQDSKKIDLLLNALLDRSGFAKEEAAG